MMMNFVLSSSFIIVLLFSDASAAICGTGSCNPPLRSCKRQSRSPMSSLFSASVKVTTPNSEEASFTTKCFNPTGKHCALELSNKEEWQCSSETTKMCRAGVKVYKRKGDENLEFRPFWRGAFKTLIRPSSTATFVICPHHGVKVNPGSGYIEFTNNKTKHTIGFDIQHVEASQTCPASLVPQDPPEQPAVHRDLPPSNDVVNDNSGQEPPPSYDELSPPSYDAAVKGERPPSYDAAVNGERPPPYEAALEMPILLQSPSTAAQRPPPRIDPTIYPSFGQRGTRPQTALQEAPPLPRNYVHETSL